MAHSLLDALFLACCTVCPSYLIREKKPPFCPILGELGTRSELLHVEQFHFGFCSELSVPRGTLTELSQFTSFNWDHDNDRKRFPEMNRAEITRFSRRRVSGPDGEHASISASSERTGSKREVGENFSQWSMPGLSHSCGQVFHVEQQSNHNILCSPVHVLLRGTGNR